MGKTRAKQERVIEAVRRGLDGMEAVAFIHESGFAVTPAAVAKHLRVMGGRARVQAAIDAGASNHDILRDLFPDDVEHIPPLAPPSQPELFKVPVAPADVSAVSARPEFETRKMTIEVPTDLYQAIRLAAHAERTTTTSLIVDILTAALSRIPIELPEDGDEATGHG